MSDEVKNNEQLKAYRQKRNFNQTQEPYGTEKEAGSEHPCFVVQKHAASRLHYDFRLEINGVLKSWAVPKGPSLNPKDRRLAVLVEDHPLDYAHFEGIIPEPEYGAGTVLVWDSGYYTNLSDSPSVETAFANGQLEFTLVGQKLKGGFVLLRTNFQGKKNNWLLIKKKDEHADTEIDIVERKPCSVLSQKTIEELAKGH